MNVLQAKRIVGILSESALYFDMDLRERHSLMVYILNTYSLGGVKPEKA